VSRKRWLVLLGAALPLLASAESALVLKDAWVRALPPTQANTAGYLEMVNSGTDAVTVVAASSNIAKRVEFHRTVEVDGLMRMEQLQEIVLSPGERYALEPGGAHLMFIDVTTMPAPGETVRFCLELASGQEVCTVAPASKSAASNGHHHH
jgi:copper(I)-binding protein